MNRLIATVAAVAVLVAAPATVAALSTTSTVTTYLRADSNDCVDGAVTCEHRVLELVAAGPGSVADICFTISQLQAIVDDGGYEIVSLERGCSQVGPTQYSVATDGQTATVTLDDFRLDTCPNGSNECTSSRTVDVTVDLIGTDSAVSPQDARATFTTRDGRCVTIYVQTNEATSATGSITIDGTAYATTGGLIGITTQTVRGTCD